MDLAHPPPLAEGRIIDGRYRVGPCIGDGGMGMVFAATHLGLGVPVAIKIIRPELARDPELVRRFVNEARAAAVLKSEHVARVHDVGKLPSGEPYLVMEYLDGVELETLVGSRELDDLAAVDIVRQACEALAEAHAIGLVHRDIKPANLFLARCPDGRSSLKILDFGISKWLLGKSQRHLTQPGGSMGSPWYMSPEQMANASAVDQRTDVWALGVVLYQLLTGELPFDGDSVPEVCAQVLTKTAVPPREHRPDLDPELEAIVMRCLEKQPARRFESVSALSDALVPFASLATLELDRSSSPASSRRPAAVALDAAHGTHASFSTSAERPRKRAHAAASIGVALLSALVTGSLTLWLTSDDPRDLETMIAAVPTALTMPWDPTLLPDTSEPLDRATPVVEEPLVFVHEDAPREREVATVPARAAVEPPLTAAQIERRRERYRDWIRDQGLRPLSTTADTSHADSILQESSP